MAAVVLYAGLRGASLALGSVLLGACALPQFQPNEPADAQVAASPDYVVEMGNFYARITDRHTWVTFYNATTGTLTVGADDPLWGHIYPATNAISTSGICSDDSRIVWDPGSGHWYRTGFWTGAGIGLRNICLAVSLTSNPRAGWWVGEIAAGDYDFMRLSFTNDHIVSLPQDSTQLRFIDKWRAVMGDFGGVIPRDVGMPFAVPVNALAGTGTEAMFVTFENSGGLPLWRVWRHGIAGNYTVTQGQPWNDASYVGAWGPAWTPNGTIAPGNAIEEAWLTGGQIHVVGTVPNAGTASGYLATLWAYVNAPPYNVRRSNVWTIFPAIAVDPASSDIIVTAIQTDPFHYPTHVMAITTPAGPDPLAFFSVQDAAAAKGFSGITPGGNGSGPVPLDPLDGVQIRGPDYLWATADPAAGVWFVGEWTQGGAWWSHTVWWN